MAKDCKIIIQPSGHTGHSLEQGKTVRQQKHSFLFSPLLQMPMRGEVIMATLNKILRHFTWKKICLKFIFPSSTYFDICWSDRSSDLNKKYLTTR